jgi:hypothetical protein
LQCSPRTLPLFPVLLVPTFLTMLIDRQLQLFKLDAYSSERVPYFGRPSDVFRSLPCVSSLVAFSSNLRVYRYSPTGPNHLRFYVGFRLVSWILLPLVETGHRGTGGVENGQTTLNVRCRSHLFGGTFAGTTTGMMI